MPKGSRKITWRRQGLEDEFPLKLADSQKISEMTVNPLFSPVYTHLPCFPLWVKQCHKPSPSHPMIIQWLSNDYPMIFQWLSNDYPMIFQGLSNDYPMIIQWFSKDYPMITQWFSNDYPMITQWFSNDCPMIIQWLPNDFPMIFQWLSNDYPMIIQYQRLNPNKESLIKAPLRLRCSVLASVSLILNKCRLRNRPMAQRWRFFWWENMGQFAIYI